MRLAGKNMPEPIVWAILLIFVMAEATSSNGDVSGRQVDLSRIDLPEDLSRVITSFIPDSLRVSLVTNYEPEFLAPLILTGPLLRRQDNVDSTYWIVYITDGIRWAALQLYRFDGDEYVFLSQDTLVGAGQPSILEYCDFDCDGVNEVLVKKAVGTAAWEEYDVIKIESDRLTNVTRNWFGRRIRGRAVTFTRNESNCTTRIEWSEDGPVRFRAQRRVVSEFDGRILQTRSISVDTLVTVPESSDN